MAHPILMTARIPLAAFAGANLSQVRAVRFVFDDTNADEIYIANIRASSVGEALSLATTAAFDRQTIPASRQRPRPIRTP